MTRSRTHPRKSRKQRWHARTSMVRPPAWAHTGRHVRHSTKKLSQDYRARLAGWARRIGNPICSRRTVLASFAL